MALLYTGAQWAVIGGILAGGIALQAAVAVWLHRDVRALGREPWPWTIACALLSVPTLIVWAFARPKPVPAPRAAPRPRAVEDEPREMPRRAEEEHFRIGLTAPVTAPRPAHGEVRAVLAYDDEDVRPAPVALTCRHCGNRYLGMPGQACPSCGGRRETSGL